MILLLCLILTGTAHAENYFTQGGAEVVSDTDISLFRTKLDLAWKGDAFEGVPGFSAPRPTTLEEPTLQATMPGSLAVVDDKVVGVGETVNGRRVRKIGPNYVLLEQGGSVKELSLEDKPLAPATAAAAPASSSNGVVPDLLGGLKGTPSNLLNTPIGRRPASVPSGSHAPEGIIEIQERLGK